MARWMGQVGSNPFQGCFDAGAREKRPVCRPSKKQSNSKIERRHSRSSVTSWLIAGSMKAAAALNACKERFVDILKKTNVASFGRIQVRARTWNCGWLTGAVMELRSHGLALAKGNRCIGKSACIIVVSARQVSQIFFVLNVFVTLGAAAVFCCCCCALDAHPATQGLLGGGKMCGVCRSLWPGLMAVL